MWTLQQFGWHNNLIDQEKIKGIEGYSVPSAEREFTLFRDDEESESKIEFTEVDNDSYDLTESDCELEPDWMYNYLYLYI